MIISNSLAKKNVHEMSLYNVNASIFIINFEYSTHIQTFTLHTTKNTIFVTTFVYY